MLQLLLGMALGLLQEGEPQRGGFVAPVEGLVPSREAQCGAECLYAAVTLLGREVHYAQLLRETGTDRQGTTLAGLRHAAGTHGLHALAVRAGRSRLCDLLQSADQRLLAICHQEPEHFVLIYLNAQGYFTLVDPACQYPNHVAKREDLEKYSGAALLLSDQPIELDLSGGLFASIGPWQAVAGLAIVLAASLALGARLGRRGPVSQPSASVPTNA